jgi:hypothetical protein
MPTTASPRKTTAKALSAHAHLIPQNATCTRLYTVTKGSPILVTSTLLTPGFSPSSKRKYRVVIRRLVPGMTNLPYGLTNIGVQAHRWHVALLEVTGTNVMLTREDPPKSLGPYTGHAIVRKRLRRIRPKGTTKPNDRLVWMLDFEGDQCELLIVSRRPEPPISIETEHDVTPPPPEGGGDEEEEGGGEDEDGDDGGE